MGTRVPRICRYTELNEKDVMNLINRVGKLLAEFRAEIVIIPCRDIPYLVAKAYKKHGGKKVIGIIPPENDKFGVEHIKPCFEVVDEKLQVSSWYHADGEIAAAGDIAICIGLSAGVVRDIGALHFHQTLLNKKTKLILFENTISSHLHPEIEEELMHTYVDSIEELEKILKKSEESCGQ